MAGDAPASSPPLILHVVESLGGGVTSAVIDYIRATPQLRHRALGRLRADAHSVSELDVLVDGVLPMRTGHLAAIADVRRAYRRLRPAIVHAHSSFAGAYARLAGLPRSRVVYTPHCFAFERLDVSRPVRVGFRLAEAVLSFRTRAIAAVSPREAALASRMPGRPRVVVVPNVASAQDVRADPAAPTGRPVVVAVGRAKAQKDPSFFAAAARAAGGAGRWIWVGGGDPDRERELRAAGVEVTGWVERGDAMALLAGADLYAHTAAWEGFPITLLEAAALGRPIVARRIPALEGSGLLLVDDPAAMAREAGLLDEREKLDDLLARSRTLVDTHDPAEQARVLSELYAEVAGG